MQFWRSPRVTESLPRAADSQSKLPFFSVEAEKCALREVICILDDYCTYEQLPLAPANQPLIMGTMLCKSCGRTGQFGVTVTRRPIGLQDSSGFEHEAPRTQERIVICS